MEKINVYIKLPFQDALIYSEIDNELEAFQNIVGGYIETLPVGDDILMVVNEEGKLLSLLPNFAWRGDYIVGPAVFCRTDGEEFVSAKEADRETIEDEIENGGR